MAEMQFESKDVLYRFTLGRSGVNGVLVRQGPYWHQMVSRVTMPPVISSLLGQTVAAGAMLAGSHPELSGAKCIMLTCPNSPLRVLFVECAPWGRFRGRANWVEPVPATLDLSALSGAIMFTITVHTEQGRPNDVTKLPLRYPDVASVLEDNFNQAGQIKSCMIRLAADSTQTAGVMLHGPAKGDGNFLPLEEDTWQRFERRFAAISEGDLLTSTPEQLLYRLFHDEPITLAKPQKLWFECFCSSETMKKMLRKWERQQLEAILDQQGQVQVACQYCGQLYTFDRVDVGYAFGSNPDLTVPATAQ